MGIVIVKIPLITWRDGRPRFIPGKRLRAMGLKGEDLRHPDGAWLTLEEAIAWSERKALQISKLETVSPRQQGRIIAAAGGMLSVSQLFDLWFREPRLNGKEVVEGRKSRRPLSPYTVRFYRNSARRLEELDAGKIWSAPAAAISAKVLDGVINRIEIKHGLLAARGVRATVSVAYGWARGRGKVPSNPVEGLAETLPMPTERVRYGSIAEMRALVAAADAIGRPDVGDAIMLGLWTGQRQHDRLDLAEGKVTPDGIVFRQSKKHGQPLLIPTSPELQARLTAARARRREWRVNYPNVILDEVSRAPFKSDQYRKIFRKVRNAAVAGVAEKGLAPMPSLDDFTDQDLRDTAVTWLALAHCDKFHIASITGHSLASIDNVLKHYLGMHPELARSAIARLVAWYEDDGEVQK